MALTRPIHVSGLALFATALLWASVSTAAVTDADGKSPVSGKIAREIAAKAAKQTGGAFKENYIGQMQSYYAEYEDTLVHIGRRFGLGFVEMRAANPHVDPWIPGSGAKITIPNMHLLPDQAPRDGIVINLAEMRIYYYKVKGEPPVTFPIGIGRDGLETPVGTTSVTRKKANPTWTPTERMRREDPKLPAFVPPGPDNPMGTHAMYLGFPLLAIHGTDKPYGIGRRVSSGCIRMFPEDIVKVFEMTPVNTKVTIVDQPIKAAWIDDKLYLEVHPTQEQATLMEREGAIPDYELSERDLSYILRVAGTQVEKLDWASIRKVVKERRGYPVVIAGKSNRQRAAIDSSVTAAPAVVTETAQADLPQADATEVLKAVRVQNVSASANDVNPITTFAPSEAAADAEAATETAAIAPEPKPVKKVRKAAAKKPAQPPRNGVNN